MNWRQLLRLEEDILQNQTILYASTGDLERNVSVIEVYFSYLYSSPIQIFMTDHCCYCLVTNLHEIVFLYLSKKYHTLIATSTILHLIYSVVQKNTIRRRLMPNFLIHWLFQSLSRLSKIITKKHLKWYKRKYKTY